MGLYTLLVLVCGIIVCPLVIVLSSSFREVDNMQSPLLLFRQFSLESYEQAFRRMNYPSALLNSVVTTVISVLCIILLAPMAAYPIARLKSKASRFFYFFFISGLIIPSQMVIVPVVQMIGRLHIPNTRFTPIIMFITCSLPFTIFLFTGFLKGVPQEIEEAAFMDGANLRQRFFKMVYPLLKPAIVSAAITQGLWIWNDYFYPMMFISKSSQFSLPVAMVQFLGDKENPAQWNILFAACVLCVLPLSLFFAVMQKQFIGGIAAGAVKG